MPWATTRVGSPAERAVARTDRLRTGPGARARVLPDLGGDPILLGLRTVLRRSLTSVGGPGRGQDLVRAARPARRVERVVVAARLAHHDVGRDRVWAAKVCGGAGARADGRALGFDLLLEVGDLALGLRELRLRPRASFGNSRGAPACRLLARLEARLGGGELPCLRI